MNKHPLRLEPCRGGCGKEIPANLATCGEKECRRVYGNAVWRGNWKTKRAEWIAQGRCHACGARPRPKKALCVDCVKARAATKARYVENELRKKAVQRIAAGRANMKIANAHRRDAVNQARIERGLPPSAAKAPVVPKDAPLPLDV